MKKIIVAVLILVLGFTCCVMIRNVSNKSWGDFVKSFEYGQVKLMDGTVIEGKVQSWLDFEDGDMIQVRINDETYLTHISNVVLISD